MFNKSIYDLTEEDMQGLVDRKICERKILDFKLCYDPKDRGELLADVCSFANCEGGWLFYEW